MVAGLGELVVGGVEEPFDRLGAVDAAELVGEPGGGGAQSDLGVDAVGGPGGCGHDAFLVGVVDGGEVADAAVDVGVGGLERGVGVDPDRVGNGPVQPRQIGASSSWALSQTATTRSPSWSWPATGTGRSAPSRSPCRCAAAMARGWMRGPGWVPADVAGNGAQLVPGGRRQLGSCRVRRAHEDHPRRRLRDRSCWWRRRGRGDDRYAVARSCGAGRLRSGPGRRRRPPRGPAGGGPAGCCPARPGRRARWARRPRAAGGPPWPSAPARPARTGSAPAGRPPRESICLQGR